MVERTIRHMSPRMDGSGEGSRGGTVIGRTSSGKPVYKSHSHSGHEDFSKQEHSEAAKVHLEKMDKLRGSGGAVHMTGQQNIEWSHHQKQRRQHLRSSGQVA